MCKMNKMNKGSAKQNVNKKQISVTSRQNILITQNILIIIEKIGCGTNPK